MKIVFAIFYCLAYATAQTDDYCAYSLCQGGAHIGCGNDGDFADTCSDDRDLITIDPYKDMIVERHNYYRNKIASGALRGYSSALRMATIQWDDELAKLAELNVKTCKLEHDECRNTDRFKYSGQNLAWRWASSGKSKRKGIQSSIESWFDEYKDASMKYINKFQSTSRAIGHFTVMVADKNTRVGCAMLKQSADGGIEYFFACNYATTNMLNYPIYEKGLAASKCSTGANPEYPALCSIDEPIDVNKFN